MKKILGRLITVFIATIALVGVASFAQDAPGAHAQGAIAAANVASIKVTTKLTNVIDIEVFGKGENNKFVYWTASADNTGGLPQAVNGEITVTATGTGKVWPGAVYIVVFDTSGVCTKTVSTPAEGTAYACDAVDSTGGTVTGNGKGVPIKLTCTKAPTTTIDYVEVQEADGTLDEFPITLTGSPLSATTKNSYSGEIAYDVFDAGGNVLFTGVTTVPSGDTPTLDICQNLTA